MLIYSMLYLTGYDLPLEQLKNFRQWGSHTPGHPEYGETPGVETTTGPLGQGVGNGIGMAIAERFQAHRYNRPDHTLLDHYIYAIASDGDLMEGVSAEAASIAGHLKLGQLIYFYDDNHITIEGDTALAFSEDVGRRFEGYHWHVQHVADVNDLEALDQAIRAAQAETERPSLIIVRSHIGFGSPNKQDTASAHGSPLGEAEIVLTKRISAGLLKSLSLSPKKPWPTSVRPSSAAHKQEQAWQEKYAAYAAAYPELAAQWERELSWRTSLPAGTATFPHLKPATISPAASPQKKSSMPLRQNCPI